MGEVKAGAHRHVARSAGGIGLATLTSRVLGFVRDILVAGLFGTAIQAQAFVVAFRIPNLLRDLVAEGAASTAFVPVFSEYRALRSREEYWRLASSVLWCVGSVLAAVTILGMLAAPLLVRLMAPGFIADPEKFALTVSLTRWLWPFIWLIGITAFGTSVLNSLDVFVLPALGPAVLNVGMIVGLVWITPHVLPQIMGSVYGVLIGGAVQLLCIVVPLAAHGMYWSPHPQDRPQADRANARVGFADRLRVGGWWPSQGAPWIHPEARRIGRLLVPRVAGSAVYQLSVFIDTILASLSAIVGEGGVAALYFANRLIQLPFAVFGISLAQASLPTLSAQAARKDFETFRRTCLFALRSAWFIMLPSTVGLWVLAGPIVRLLFQHGQFDTYSTASTAGVLRWYTLGLMWYASGRLCVNAFYALQETWVPVRTAAVALLTNLVLNIILMFPMRLNGLALATSVSSMTNCLQLFVLLQRRVGAFDRRALLSSLARMGAAALAMAVCAHAGWMVLSRQWGERGMGGALAMAVVMAGSSAVYLAASWLLRVEEVASLKRWIWPSK